MLRNRKRQILKDEKGQALFEFIIFMPFLIYLFTVMVTVSNSINASINQQKSTRGYFYYLLKGNSMLPTRADLNDYASRGLGNIAGLTAIGWRERGEENAQFAPCFKFSTLFSPSDSGTENETCEEAAEGLVSQFVRVYTLYGICGATYSTAGTTNGYFAQYPNPNSIPFFSSSGCRLR